MSLRRQYEAAIRRNAHIPAGFSLAPRPTRPGGVVNPTDELIKAAERLMADSEWWRQQIDADTDPATARLYEGRSEGLRWGAAAIRDALPDEPAR